MQEKYALFIAMCSNNHPPSIQEADNPQRKFVTIRELHIVCQDV